MFKKIIPRSRSSYGDIKVSFSGDKTLYVNIYISSKLLDKLGWGHECRVFVYFDDENPKIWMIEKADNEQEGTFKLAKFKFVKSGLSKLQFKFSLYKIITDDRKLKPVNYEIEDGKILIRN